MPFRDIRVYFKWIAPIDKPVVISLSIGLFLNTYFFTLM